MTPPADATSAGLIPIVVGVTGHRDLRDADIAPLEAAVRRFLERFRRDYPSSPLVLITPLAEGADRLAARAALELGAELVAPSPLPRAEYAKDIPSTVGEFDRLFDDDRTVRRLELPAIGHERAVQYALAGAFVARQSHVLLALWDGVESDSVGGTSQVIAYRRSGRFGTGDFVGDQLELAPEPYALSSTPLDPHDTGPVYQIATPRKDRPSPDDPFSGSWLLPEHSRELQDGDATPASLSQTLARIDAFNRDALRILAAREATVDTCARWLHDKPLETVSRSLGGLRRSFAVADALASGFQRETYQVMWSIYGLAMLAVLMFQLYAHAFPDEDPRVVIFLAGYVAVLGVADVVYLVARQRQSQNKFQDYRALAEGLRVQFYWRLAGLERSAADYYLRKQRDELAWIREAIRAAGIRAAPARDGDVGALASGWIESQCEYYTRSTRRERDRLSGYRYVAGGVIFASLLWAIPSVALNLRALPEGGFNWTRILQVPLLIVSLVLAWHLAFKGSQVIRGAPSRTARALFAELRPFLFGALGGGLFFLLVRVLSAWAHARWPEVEGDRQPWSVLSLSVVTVAGALIHSMTDKRAFGEHARQYARMAESFNRAGDRMDALLHDGKLDRARALAVELGKEALAEHGDWLMLHRERPIKLPKI
jgi:hypothetical protein